MSVHGTYDTSGARPVLRFERRIEHPVEAVWRAVSDPEQLRRWFPTEVRGDLTTPGAPLRFVFEGDEEEHPGEVRAVAPPSLLAFEWFGDVLRFELEPAGDGATRLRMTHELAEIDAAARTMAGWTICLDHVALAIAGERWEAPQGPTDEWRAHYAHYVDAGVPAGAPVPGS